MKLHCYVYLMDRQGHKSMVKFSPSAISFCYFSVQIFSMVIRALDGSLISFKRISHVGLMVGEKPTILLLYLVQLKSLSPNWIKYVNVLIHSLLTTLFPAVFLSAYSQDIDKMWS